MVKTAEFGQPCRAPEPGRCRICGCSNTDACVLGPANGEKYGCGWVDETMTLCDAPRCVEEARREIGR